jgi:hypothetical protein
MTSLGAVTAVSGGAIWAYLGKGSTIASAAPVLREALVQREARDLVKSASGAGGLAAYFALSRIGMHDALRAAPEPIDAEERQGLGRFLPKLAPANRDVLDLIFRGFGNQEKSTPLFRVDIEAVHQGIDGQLYAHQLWSHAPQRLGGTSGGVVFTASRSHFAGFAVRHTDISGRSGAVFYPTSGANRLDPGVYVFAGPRQSSGQLPQLADGDFTGNLSKPLSTAQVDFDYLSLLVSQG